jgi:CHAT domain-containing protein
MRIRGKPISITVLLLMSGLRLLALPVILPPGGASPVIPIVATYQKALAYFNAAHPTAGTDSMALLLFSRVIGEAKAGHLPDDLLLQSWIDKGILLDVKNRYQEALIAYDGAFGCLRRHQEWNDSLYFRVYIYAGQDYYQTEAFDSAYACLNRAADLADRWPGLREKDRLYNALGALYFESGNYLQARDYFGRALEVIRQQRPNDRSSTVNFENNIASCLYKLGDYRRSIDLYSQLVAKGAFSGQLYLNMGRSYVELREYDEAMDCFHQVKPAQVPGVLNEMAYAQFLTGRDDSALFFLDQYVRPVDATGQSRIDAGVNDLYRAEVMLSKGEAGGAMNALQKAIILFSGNFADPDIHVNPLNFTGAFESYRLFDAIVCKARAWQQLYRQSHRDESLLGAWQTYRSAIMLFRHIEETYTTDDAKLFLKKNNADLYHNAFTVCLGLDRLHPDGGYLEQAFLIAEKSKASILSENLNFIASRNIPGVDPRLLERQRALKYAIARLDMKGDADQKAAYEIELSRLQHGLESNDAYKKMSEEDTSLTVRSLCDNLRDDQAVISLFVMPGDLHIFTLTKDAFHHLVIDSMSFLGRQAAEWISMLNDPSPGRRFGQKNLEQDLYRRLIHPLLVDLEGKQDWIVIPDGIFHLLPLESLPADDGSDPLIESKTISYEPSAGFLKRSRFAARPAFGRYTVLSFAPFAGDGQWVQAHGNRWLDRLPSSGEEIAGLRGAAYLDAQATKARFLQELNRFPVVHLATHALSDSQTSLICFFPQHKGPGEDALYLPELYGLNMDSTELVILSACESGKGEIVDNEGMMSLSRGFLYAGVASTINSLWKADDRSTEDILRRFHHYLEEGDDKAVALRRAKLDYIHGNATYTSPNFWAHLILVGNTDPVVPAERSGRPRWELIAVLVALIPLGVATVRWIRRIISPPGWKGRSDSSA